nr:immunoglobulin light chain junction region [Macaca mulatta]
GQVYDSSANVLF